MVLGLLSAALFSIVCFIVAVFKGLTVHGPAAVTQHILWGFLATFMVTLSQSMTMFYFIGTGKFVKDLVANQPSGNEFIRRTKVFKAKVFPPALWAMLFTMATMIIGGGVHTHASWTPPWLHASLAGAGLYFNVLAFYRDAKYMIEHNLLMQELERILPK